MNINGYTIEELMKIRNVNKKTLRKLLCENGIEPIYKGFLYPLDTPEKIKNENPVGRPKKEKQQPNS